MSLQENSQETDGTVTAVLAIEDDESSRQWWPYAFRLELSITVGADLRLALTTRNKGLKAFQFEEALHTYYRVGAAAQASVTGLADVTFLDNTESNQSRRQNGAIVFTKAIDNAYIDTTNPVELADPVFKRKLLLQKTNSATTVVWNPWQQGAASLADLGDSEWQQLACVEASNILQAAITLEPGATHTLGATISVHEL